MNSQVARTAIRKGDGVQVMHPMPSLRYDTRSDITSLPAMKQLLSWARFTCPMLYSKYVKADSAFFHAMEHGKGRDSANKFYTEYADAFNEIRAKFVAAHS